MTIQDWIDALLSGKYKQAKGKLRNEAGFCCLGVACDIKDSSRWKLPSYSNDSYYLWGDEEEGFFLPMEVVEELDVSGAIQTEVTIMNDTGKSFAEIAARLKEYAEGK